MEKDEKELIRLELLLHTREARSSRKILDSLIADEFREIGASGAYFGKQNVLDDLPSEDEIRIEACDFEYRRLSESIAHLTYKSKFYKPIGTLARTSYRTSIWKLKNGKWQMVFHQGTLTGV